MDNYSTLINETVDKQVGIELESLTDPDRTSDPDQTVHADTPTSPTKIGTSTVEASRLGIREDTKRQLVDNVIGLLSNSVLPQQTSTQANAQKAETDTAMAGKPVSDENESNNKYRGSSILVPLKDGYKLDLRDLPADALQKNMKVKIDTDEYNVKVKNVMKEVAKYGDKNHQSRTATKGVLTISILLQNVAQLKRIIKAGQTGTENFWFLVILIPISLLVQIVGGVMIVYLGQMETETNQQIKTSYSITKWILYVSSAASLLHTVIAALLLAE